MAARTLLVLALLLVGAAGANAAELRVCADPNNMPFSDRDGAGFENKLATLVASRIGRDVAYTWWAQRRGFVRSTLNAGDCDAVMGVPVDLDMLAVTRPYYKSAFVFVSRADRAYRLASLKDARLRQLTVGVQLIGDDGFNTPPAHALGEQGIVANVVGYTVYGDYRDPHPASRIIDAVADGSVDVAVAWGPMAGYFARLSATPLAIEPVADGGDFAPLRFAYAIGIGVRKTDQALRQQIDDVLRDARPEIDSLLRSYGVPMLDLPDPAGR